MIFVSVLTSAVVSFATVQLAMRSGLLELDFARRRGDAPPAAVASDARVPELVGLTVQAADELLAALKLRIVVSERRSDPAAPNGLVLAQQPLAQSRVPAGSEISVVLSIGPAMERTQVPVVVGKTLAEAKALLETSFLHVGSTATGGDGETGSVTGVVPNEGTSLDRGASVALMIAEAKIEVPRLINEHISQARERLAKAGLTVGDVSEIYDSRKRGNRVLSQDPEAGAQVSPGTAIRLVVNQGD